MNLVPLPISTFSSLHFFNLFSSPESDSKGRVNINEMYVATSTESVNTEMHNPKSVPEKPSKQISRETDRINLKVCPSLPTNEA